MSVYPTDCKDGDGAVDVLATLCQLSARPWLQHAVVGPLYTSQIKFTENDNEGVQKAEFLTVADGLKVSIGLPPQDDNREEKAEGKQCRDPRIVH